MGLPTRKRFARKFEEMNKTGIIIEAFKAEARCKPDEKIFFGKRVFTYKEFVEILNGKRKQMEYRALANSFLSSAKKMFDKNPTYRKQILQMAGVSE